MIVLVLFDENLLRLYRLKLFCLESGGARQCYGLLLFEVMLYSV